MGEWMGNEHPKVAAPMCRRTEQQFPPLKAVYEPNIFAKAWTKLKVHSQQGPQQTQRKWPPLGLEILSLSFHVWWNPESRWMKPLIVLVSSSGCWNPFLPPKKQLTYLSLRLAFSNNGTFASRYCQNHGPPQHIAGMVWLKIENNKFLMFEYVCWFAL